MTETCQDAVSETNKQKQQGDPKKGWTTDAHFAVQNQTESQTTSGTLKSVLESLGKRGSQKERGAFLILFLEKKKKKKGVMAIVYATELK